MTENTLNPDRFDQLRELIADQQPQVLEDLMALARIPSVSLPSFDAAQVARSAEAVADLLRDVGAQTRVVSADGGHPAVIGTVPGPAGAPTVLLYAHHDVQPPGDPADWSTPTFEPTRVGDRLFGRGVADDKAGVMAHIAALRAHEGRPPVNVVVFVEGEEEAGSESLPALLREHRQELACDALVIADSANWAVGTPALTTTLRGNVRVVVQTRALDHGVHSGMFGGVVPDGITAMCRLLATLHDEQGSVAVAGLRSSQDTHVDYDQDRLRADAGALPGVELIGRGPYSSRLWTQPAVTVTGIDAPGVDEAANLLTPSCRAMLSLRIAPQEDPEQAVEHLRAHLLKNAPWGVHVEVHTRDSGAGFVASTQGPYVAAAKAAFADAWGTPSVDMGMGGSIPFIAEFAETFPDAAILVTGVEDPDTRAHGADESLHLGEFERVCLAEALLLERIGSLRR